MKLHLYMMLETPEKNKAFQSGGLVKDTHKTEAAPPKKWSVITTIGPKTCSPFFNHAEIR